MPTRHATVGSAADQYTRAAPATFLSQTAVERELMLWLASLLWWFAPCTAIETRLLQIQCDTVANSMMRRRAGQGEIAIRMSTGVAANAHMSNSRRR